MFLNIQAWQLFFSVLFFVFYNFIDNVNATSVSLLAILWSVGLRSSLYDKLSCSTRCLLTAHRFVFSNNIRKSWFYIITPQLLLKRNILWSILNKTGSGKKTNLKQLGCVNTFRIYFTRCVWTSWMKVFVLTRVSRLVIQVLPSLCLTHICCPLNQNWWTVLWLAEDWLLPFWKDLDQYLIKLICLFTHTPPP